MNNDDLATPAGNVSRRDALKRGAVGAAVAGAVWNAPQMKGLSIRPRYAAAASGGATTGSSTVGPTMIPDNDPVGIDTPVAFVGLACSITSVSITLDIAHTWIGDLTIILTGPGGSVTLLNGSQPQPDGLCNDFGNYGTQAPHAGLMVTLQDSAGTGPIGGIGCPFTGPGETFTGTYQPDSALSLFNGQDPNGAWAITIIDGQSLDTGTLTTATLTITAA